MSVIDILATSGVTLLLAAFLLQLLGKLTPAHTSYSLLNFFGAGLACASALLAHFWPFVVLEGVWALVAAVSLIHHVSLRMRSAH